jgi:hypothetical protein
MSAQPVPNTASRAHRNVPDATAGAARAGATPDLGTRSPASPRRLGHPSVTVQVAGGTQQDRMALATALLRAGSGRVAFPADPGGALGVAVDAVLLVVSAAQVIGAAELDVARTLRHRSSHILLALTAVDRHPSWRDVLAADLERLRAAGVPVTPFAVAIDMHRRAGATGDPVIAAASGIPALARYLDDIAGPAAPGTARTTPAAAPRRAPVRRGRGRRVPDRGRWQQVLADGAAAVSSDVDFDLRSRVRAAIADAERVVETSDPARDWSEIETWFRDRLTYEGEQTFALLADRTAEVTATLERELGGRPLRRPALDALPDFFGHQPLRDAPVGARRPLATRGRSLVMSGFSGLMMALILPRFTGVQLPVWVVVAGALGAALLLGGATLSGERRRQLETSRSRAKSQIRNTADDFQLVATKATRDTLRRSQQQLRDECAARVQRPKSVNP